MGWAIFGVLIILFLMAGRSAHNKNQKNLKDLEQQGFLLANKIDVGKYISGHPRIDVSFDDAFIIPKTGSFFIFRILNKANQSPPVIVGNIEYKSISNVIAEDQSTFEKKVTAGRLLALGLFAFAVKKNVKTELAYLTINWNDGKFEHHTVFEFAGKQAIQNANIARNRIISFC